MNVRTGPSDVEQSSPAAAGTSAATGWPRVLWYVGTVLLIGMAFHIVALVVTGGPVSGPLSLRKPAAFAETGWLVAWSVALVLPLLRTKAWQRHVVGTAVVLFGVGETTVIGVQAWRGVPSHYNFSTPLDTALMRGGAAGFAGLFLIGMVTLLVATLRTPGTAASVRLGVVAGIVVLLVGCVIGFVMIFNNSGVFQGGVGADFPPRGGAYLGPDAATVGPEYLLLRPATDGGDLILIHAIGVHGLLLLAVPAVLLARTTMGAARQWQVTAAAVASVAVATVALLIHALRQLPLERLHPLSLAVLALCAVTLTGTYAITAAALWRRRRSAAAA